MLIIAVTEKANHLQGLPLKYSQRDLAFASYYLSERVQTLKNFLDLNCRIISEGTLQEELTTAPLRTSPNLILWEEQFVLFDMFEKVTWETVIFLYALATSLTKEKTFAEVIAYVEQRKVTDAIVADAIYNLREKVRNEARKKIELVPYFNYKEFIKETNKIKGDFKVKARRWGSKVAMEIDNVKLGNEKEGYIIYNKIIIFLNDWQLDGYMLRFTEFDFSSYWNFPHVILHPFLEVPLCRNDVLMWHNPQHYKEFAELIYSIATEYDEYQGNESVQNIVQNFQILRKIWNGNRYEAENRLELSKMIFSEFSQETK